jgi:hypothetical protein
MPHYCIWRRNVGATIKFDLLACWLKRCDEEHQHQSVLETTQRTIDDLRFIDVYDRCVVRRNQHTRYAALSYTWSSREQFCLTKDNTHLLEQTNSLSNPDITISAIATDAVKVCIRLAIPYLWIDSLCIVQDDHESKHTQIQNMDVIYANAYVRLIDASDREVPLRTNEQRPDPRPDSGLARVSEPIRGHNPDLTIDGISYSCSEDVTALSSMFVDSPWFSRGWHVLSPLLTIR